MAADAEVSRCSPSPRLRELIERRKFEDIERARARAAELIIEMNNAGGPFAHPAECGCCGCRAAARHLRAVNVA